MQLEGNEGKKKSAESNTSGIVGNRVGNHSARIRQTLPAGVDQDIPILILAGTART